MPDDSASISPTLRAKISTGYGRLDEALQGGLLAGSAIVLSAPASDEVPLLVGNFLRASKEPGLLICRTLSAAETVTHNVGENVRSLVCSEKPTPPSKNIMPGKGIENLTDLNFQIEETVNSVQPKRIVVEILSDILLRHKAIQTRKWLSELLERFRSKNITTLAVLNPYMHSGEEVQAVVDLFDGNLELFEKDIEGTLGKFLRIKWMHGIEAAEKEFPLIDLGPEPQTATQQVAVTTASLKEPRWLTPLVSRTAELAKLKTQFENALANRSSLVALQGEAGVGKTRLMQELAVYAQSKGAIVLSGSASEDGLPYAPWIEVTRQHVAQAPSELLRRMLGPNVSELVKLVPDIAAKLGTIPPSKSLGEQQEKIRFYEAVTQFFIAICKDAPLLLLFDDMQYVDQTSLDLLEYFVRSASNLRVLTVCSLQAILEANSPLEQSLMKFNKQRLLETVSVKGLNKDETAMFIKQTFGEQTISPEFADLIYQHTGGNPFFVEEVLRSLVEDGTIFRTEKGWDRKPIQDITIPKTVKNALKSRLEKLDPETLNVLTIASVIGSEFDFEVLQEASQLNEDTLLDKTEKALSAGLILEVTTQRNKFRFTDERIRELLLDDLSRIRRGRHHLKVAEAMEKVYSKNLESHAEAVAHHFSESGDTERGIKYSVMAGDRNRAIHAHEQAMDDYKQALDLIDLEGGGDIEKALLLEKLAGSYAYAGKLENSVQCYEQALTVFEKLNETKACARVCLGLADAVSRRGSRTPHDRILVLERGLKYLEGQPESFESSSFYSELARDHAMIDEWNEANAWAEKALEVGEKTGNIEAVARALAIQASFLTDSGRIDEGLPLWEQALDKALRHEDYALAFWALVNLSAYTYPRDLGRARKFIVQLLELAQRVNDIWWQGAARRNLCFLDWRRGDWGSAQENIQKLFEISDRLGLTGTFAEPFYTRAHLFLTIGDMKAAEADLQKALEVSKQFPKITNIVATHLGLGLLRLEQGGEDEARVHFETCVNAFAKWEFTTDPLLHIETLVHLTSIYARHGEKEKARMTSDWAKRLAEQLRSDAGLAMASQAEATLLIASADRKGAEEASRKSLEFWEKAGWSYYQAKALVEYADFIAKTSPQESRKRFEHAIEIFKKLGAKRDIEKTQAKLTAQS